MAVTYYAILTTVGTAKLANAAAIGTTLQITQMAVGDGGGNVPVPDANRTTLVNEVRRAPLNQLKIDPGNASQIIAEQVIPETVGGWWIREIGLLDNTGALIAIANCAPSYKPQLAEGSGRTQTVRMVLIVNNTGAVELKIDPSVVLATREYVDSAIVTAINRQDAKASVRAATTANIALNGLLTVDGVVLVAGDRVLVKNQNTGSQNGLYVVAAGAWARSADADENAEVTPSLTVSVESGTTQADTVWQLTTDAPIVVGTTALVFQDITNGLARLASPTFTGNPTAPTPPKLDNDTSIATTAFVKQNGVSHSAAMGIVASRNMDAGDLGANIVATANVTYTVLSGAAVGARAGDTVTLVSFGLNTITVAFSGCSYMGAATANIAVKPFESMTLVYEGSDSWRIVASTATLGLSASFGASLASSGYQKLPSGLIIQWGITSVAANNVQTNQTLPIAWPNAFLQGAASWLDTAPPSGSIGLNPGSNPLTQISLFNSYASAAKNVRWIALGY